MAGQIINRGTRIWLVRAYLGTDPQTGKREYFNKTVHGNKKDAETVLNQTLSARDKGEIVVGGGRATVDVLLAGLLLDYEINGKRLAGAKTVVNRHLKPAFGKIPISRLNSDHISRYIAERRAAGAANATVNNELAILRRSFNLGKKTRPPKVLIAPPIPRLAVNNVRAGFFERPDFLILREALPGDLKPPVTAAYHWGMRRGELLNLLWDQVDLIARMVRLERSQTKNKSARLLPLNDELFQMLSMQKAIRDEKYPDSPWVFSRNGAKIRVFRKAWATACKRVGLWVGDEKTGRPSKLFHDLRRTGVRNLVRAGVPEKVAQQISGHKTRAVFDRYDITQESDLVEAMLRLQTYHTRIDEQAEMQRQIGAQTPNPHTIRTQYPKTVN
jgi:integrase